MCNDSYIEGVLLVTQIKNKIDVIQNLFPATSGPLGNLVDYDSKAFLNSIHLS
jgi:hypothetical protein